MISQTTLTLIAIIIIALIWGFTPQPAAAAAPLAIRRESGPISYMAALDHSLRVGDGRLVPWNQVVWEARNG